MWIKFKKISLYNKDKINMYILVFSFRYFIVIKK